MKTDKHFGTYLAEFLLECKMFRTKFAEEIKIHIIFNNLLFIFTIFTFAPCMLLYLFYSKPTHALFLNTHLHLKH
jgi:hypothetical protein